jgi:hypothetical protein
MGPSMSLRRIAAMGDKQVGARKSNRDGKAPTTMSLKEIKR